LALAQLRLEAVEHHPEDREEEEGRHQPRDDAEHGRPPSRLAAQDPVASREVHTGSWRWKRLDRTRSAKVAMIIEAMTTMIA
jgi:hypothetical protein